MAEQGTEFHTSSCRFSTRKRLTRLETHPGTSVDTFELLHKILKERVLGRFKLMLQKESDNGYSAQRRVARHRSWRLPLAVVVPIRRGTDDASGVYLTSV